MTKTCVLFVQGGGEGAHDEDAALAASLQRALGGEYEVHFPRMPDEPEKSMSPAPRPLEKSISWFASVTPTRAVATPWNVPPLQRTV